MEKEFKKLKKNALGCMYVATGVGTIIGTGILTGIIIHFNLLKYKMILAGYIVIMAICILNAIISPHFRYHRYRYRLDEDSMEIIEGYIFISHSIVPIERIQNLELKQGPIDRMFGVSKMVITTGGADVTARFVAKEIADEMSKKLKVKINQMVVSDREDNKDVEEC